MEKKIKLSRKKLANAPELHQELQQIQGVLNLFQEAIAQNVPLPTPEEWEQFESNLMTKFRETAEVPLILASLREERQRIGFAPIAFAEYVQGLAKSVGVSLSPVLEWLGIGNLSKPEQGTAQAFATLAREIGLSLRETLVQIKIGFAAQFEGLFNPIPVSVRHRSGSTRRSQLEDCETVLKELESEYDMETLRALRSIESEISASYEAHDNASP
jgi:hypothetical protein